MKFVAFITEVHETLSSHEDGIPRGRLKNGFSKQIPIPNRIRE